MDYDGKVCSDCGAPLIQSRSGPLEYEEGKHCYGLADQHTTEKCLARQAAQGDDMADEPTCPGCGAELWGDDGEWYIFECNSRLAQGDGSFDEHTCCKTAQIAKLQAIVGRLQADSVSVEKALNGESSDALCRLAQKAAGLRRIVDENHDWCCGCGDWNGPNLAKCGMCGRTRQASLLTREAAEAAGEHDENYDPKHLSREDRAREIYDGDPPCES